MHNSLNLKFLLFYFCYKTLTEAVVVTKCCNQRTRADSDQPCIAYDNNMMAETLDEAMFTFPNLASPDQKPLFSQSSTSSDTVQPSIIGTRVQSISQEGTSENVPFVGSPLAAKISISAVQGNYLGDGGGVVSGNGCTTYACMSCKLSIVNGFLADPNMSSQDMAAFSMQREELVTKLGTTTGTCSNGSKKSRGYSERKDPDWKSAPRKKPDPAKAYVLMQSVINSNNQVDTDADFESASTSTSFSNQTKSSANNDKSGSNVLGVVTNLGCDYRRGSALYANSPWCGLCNLCWQWRKLPSDYFPKFLNEVNCDHNDNGCLSGFGACKPIIRSVNVMRKNGDQWQELSIDSTTACECQVEIGTPLHGLVIK